MRSYTEKPNADQLEHVYLIACALLQDAKNTFIEYRSVEFDRDMLTLAKRKVNEGLSFFTRTLPNLSVGLLSYLENNSGSYPNFAKKGAHEYPAFLSGMFKQAYDVTAVDHERAVGFIYQFSNSFKKLKGPYDELTLQKQMEEFITVDQQLPEEFSEADNLIIGEARSFLTKLFNPINEDESILYDNIVPRPGPGATNTPVAQHERYRFNNIYNQLNSFFSFDEWFYPTYHEFKWDIPYFKSKYK